MTAIYYQKTTNNEIEYHLIELVTIRETLLTNYKLIEKNILEKKEIFNYLTILKCLKCLNSLRLITLELFEQILLWQKMFVYSKRPIILNSDYLLNIITSTEFLNTSRIRKYFNFTIMRGNIFLLPMSTGKPKDIIIITNDIMNEIQLLCNPDMDRIINAYKLLQDSLPKKKFQDVLPLHRWINNIWMPNVKVSSLPSLTNSLQPSIKVINKNKSNSPNKKPFKVSSPRQTSPRIFLNDISTINNRQINSAPSLTSSRENSSIPQPPQSPITTSPIITQSKSKSQSKSTPKSTSKSINKIKNTDSIQSNNSQQQQQQPPLSPIQSSSQSTNKKFNESIMTEQSKSQSQILPQLRQSQPITLSTTQLREWYLKSNNNNNNNDNDNDNNIKSDNFEKK